jgi:DNA-binding LytR/AlgR family response regulator
MEEQLQYKTRKKSRLIVKKGEENIALKVEDIAFLFRQDTIIIVVDKELKKYVCPGNLVQLENDLDNTMFFRINRKYILNINCIKSYRAYEKVKLLIKPVFPDTDVKFVVSQEMAPVFKRWISEDL